MARYIPAPDLWDPATRADLDAGRLILQPGQWIKCGSRALSRFYRHNMATGHIVAFHGPAPHATRKLRSYIASGTALRAKRAAHVPTYRVYGATLRRLPA